MKISQTDTQLIATQGGKGNVVGGVFFALIGIAFIIGLAVLSNNPNVKTTGNSAFGYIFGGVFVLIGIVMALFATNRTVTLNKGGTSTVVSRRIIGSKEADQSFSTADVVSVSLTTGPGSNGSMMMGTNTGNRRLSTLTLLLKGNSVIQVGVSNGGPGFSISGISTNLIQKAPLSKEANTIATFLGVPLQEANMTNPIAAVESMVGALRNPASQPIESVTTTVPPVVTPPSVAAQPIAPAASLAVAPTPAQQPVTPTPPTPPNQPL